MESEMDHGMLASQWGDAVKALNAQRERAEKAEAALTSEREAHAGLRARLGALADEWHEKFLQAESSAKARENLSDRSALEVFATTMRLRIGDLRALAAESAAPVAAEEGGAR